jgi:type IX secretion system substrate protein
MKKRLHLLILMVAFFAAAGIANAVTYTFYVETGGNDTNNGLSRTTPFATMQKALDTAMILAPFDDKIIYVTMTNSSDYYNGSVIAKSQNTSIIGTNDAMAGVGAGYYPIIDGKGGSDNYGIYIHQDRIDIKNFTIRAVTNAGDFAAGKGTGIYLRGWDLNIENITIDSCGWGIYHLETLYRENIRNCRIGQEFGIFKDVNGNGGVGISSVYQQNFLKNTIIGGSLANKNYFRKCEVAGIRIGQSGLVINASNLNISYNDFDNCGYGADGFNNGAIVIGGELTNSYSISNNTIDSCHIPLVIQQGTHTGLTFANNTLTQTTNPDEIEVVADTSMGAKTLEQLIATGNNNVDNGLSAAAEGHYSQDPNYEVHESKAYPGYRIIRSSIDKVYNNDIHRGSAEQIIVFPGDHYESLYFDDEWLRLYGYGTSSSRIYGIGHELYHIRFVTQNISFIQDGDPGIMFIVNSVTSPSHLDMRNCASTLNETNSEIFGILDIKEQNIDIDSCELNGGAGLGNKIFSLMPLSTASSISISDNEINDLGMKVIIGNTSLNGTVINGNTFEDGDNLFEVEFISGGTGNINFNFYDNEINGSFRCGFVIDSASNSTLSKFGGFGVFNNKINAGFTENAVYYNGESRTSSSSSFIYFDYNWWGSHLGPYSAVYNEVNSITTHPRITSTANRYTVQFTPWNLSNSVDDFYAPIEKQVGSGTRSAGNIPDGYFYPGFRAAFECSEDNRWLESGENYRLLEVDNREFLMHNESQTLIITNDHSPELSHFAFNGQTELKMNIVLDSAEVYFEKESGASDATLILGSDSANTDTLNIGSGSSITLENCDLHYINLLKSPKFDASSGNNYSGINLIGTSRVSQNYHSDSDEYLFPINNRDLGISRKYFLNIDLSEHGSQNLKIDVSLTDSTQNFPHGDYDNNIGTIWKVEKDNAYTDTFDLEFLYSLDSTSNSFVISDENFPAYWQDTVWVPVTSGDYQTLLADTSARMEISTTWHQYWTVFNGLAALTPAPSVQASSIQFQSALATTLGMSWVNGNGDNVMVFARVGSTVAFPRDGEVANAAANSNFALAGRLPSDTNIKVLYYGPADVSSIGVTGLSPGTEYTFGVASCNGSGNLTNYNNDPSTYNPRSKEMRPLASISMLTPNICVGDSVRFEVKIESARPGSNNFSILYNDGHTSYLDRNSNVSPVQLSMLPHPNSLAAKIVLVRDQSRRICMIEKDTAQFHTFTGNSIVFTETSYSYCVSDLNNHNINSIASPSGGEFSGTGISEPTTGVFTFNANTAGEGSHTITYSYTNPGGCAGSTTTLFAVISLPSRELSPYPDTVLCQGDSVMIIASAGAGHSYVWYHNNTIIPNANNSHIYAKESGDYRCSITSNGTNCQVESMTTSVTSISTSDIQVGLVSVTEVTTNQINISWNSVARAFGYKLTVATDSLFSSIVSGYNDLDLGNVLSQNITGLARSTTYFIKLRAYTNCGVGEYSAAISQNTLNSNLSVFPSDTMNYGDVTESTCSDTFIITVEASDLSSNLLITPPLGVELSIDGTNFIYNNSSPLSLVPDGSGDIATTSVYSRYCPTGRTTLNGEIVIYSSNAADTLLVAGRGVAAAPTVQASCLNMYAPLNSPALHLTYTKGNGENRILVVNTKGDPVTWEPTDGVVSSGNLDSDHNATIMHNITGIIINLSSSNIAWQAKIYEYNGDGRYLRTGFDSTWCCVGGAGNPARDLYLKVDVNGGANVSKSQSFDLKVTLIDKASNPAIASDNITGTLTNLPTDFVGSTSFTIPSGQSSVTLSRSINTGGQTGVSVTAQASCSDYVRAGTSAQFDVNAGPPAQQARFVMYSGASGCNGEVDLTYRFRRASIPGDGVMVVARLGAKPETPSTGIDYTANVNWGSAGTYGTNNENHVVHLGAYTTNTTLNLNNVPNTGNRTIWIQAFEYNGTTYQTRSFNVNNGSLNPRATTLPAPCLLRQGEIFSSVELGEFSAMSSQKQVFTNWNTINEENIIGYELFRVNIKNFDGNETMTKIADYLNNPELQSSIKNDNADYSFVDSDPSLVAADDYLYRLHYVGLDGNSTFFSEEIVTINETSDGPTSQFELSNVSPQPAKTFVNFDLRLLSDQSLSIKIIDISGREVVSFTRNQTYSKGMSQVQIPFNGLASGSYFISVSNGQDAVLEKFVISK